MIHKLNELNKYNFFTESNVYINSMDEFYYNYESILKYIKVRLFKDYDMLKGLYDAEDILHNLILNFNTLFNNIEQGNYDKDNLAFKEHKGIHILYIKKAVKFECLVLIRNLKTKSEHISNKEDINDYLGRSSSLTSLYDEGLSDSLNKEILLSSLEDSIKELDEGEQVMIKFSELLSTTQISEIIKVDYNKLLKFRKDTLNKLKGLIESKIDNKVTEEKLKKIYQVN